MHTCKNTEICEYIEYIDISLDETMQSKCHAKEKFEKYELDKGYQMDCFVLIWCSAQ